MDYREKNKWFITASKLKLFLDSPLLYKAVYIDEVDLSEIKKSSAIELWAMIDKYLLTPMEFNDEYCFPVWSLKAELIEHCKSNNIPLEWNEKVDELKAKIYWDKKVLTDAQAEVVRWIADEVLRQPLWDNQTKYEAQKELVSKYNWLDIKGTLDRFCYNEEYGVATIRDLKSTSQMYYNNYAGNTQFYADLATRDTFHYKLQMALYVRLVKQNYPDVKKIDVIIDAVWTSDPYFYQAILLDTSELETLWETLVIPLLEAIIKMNEWNQMLVETSDRNKLCANWYYRLWTEDCIQKDFDRIPPIKDDMSTLTNTTQPEDSFDRDSL